MKRISAILFFAGTATAAVAQTNAVKTLTLDDCVAQALQHNFDVQNVRYGPVISLDNLSGAYGGWDPTFKVGGLHTYDQTPGGLTDQQLLFPPSITYQNEFNSSLGGVTPFGTIYSFNGDIGDTRGTAEGGSIGSTIGNIGVNLTQPLLKNFWIDDTRLTIYVDRNRVKYSEQGLRLQLITTVAAVETAYYELAYAIDNVTVQGEALKLAAQQLSDDQQRVRIQVLAEHGGTIEQDEAQVASSRASLILAQYTLESDQNALKNLISDNYVAWHDTDIMPADKMEAVRQLFDVQDSWSLGLTLRPELLQDKLNVEQQGIELKYFRNQLFPELDLIGGYGYNGAYSKAGGYAGTVGQFADRTSPTYNYGAQLTVPLANVAARAALKSGKATKEQLILKELEQNVMVGIDNAVKQAESGWESVEATRDQRIYAEVALSAEQQKYAVGKSTTFTVLQLQNNVTTARSAEVRSLANYNQYLVALAQQEGSILKQRNIDIEVK
jgi:HAE1 family hydrophobic/amphiphilic exporter-1